MLTPRYTCYLQLLLTCLLIFTARCWIIEQYGSETPFLDEWAFMAQDLVPWMQGEYTLQQLTAAYDGNYPALTRLIHLSLFTLNQQLDPLVAMVFNALLHALTLYTLGTLLYHHFGSHTHPYLLIGFAALWTIPFGWQNTLSGLQTTHYLYLLSTLLILWALLLKPARSNYWWIGICIAGASYFIQTSSGLILIVIISIKAYQRHLEPKQADTHTLIACFILLCLHAIGWTQTPPTPSTTPAPDISTFFLAFAHYTAFPWVHIPLFSLLIYLPFIIYVSLIINTKRRLAQRDLFLLALGGWTILQTLVLAYGYGGAHPFPASRHLEILAMSFIINGLSLFMLRQTGEKRLTKLYALAWIGIISSGLTYEITQRSLPAMLAYQQGLTQELVYLRQLMLTGDATTYLAKHNNGLAHTFAPQIPLLLAQPLIRRILPPSVTIPSPLTTVQTLPPHQTFIPASDKDYGGEQVLSACHTEKARFVSQPIEIEQSFIILPLLGLTPGADVELQMISVANNRYVNLKPEFSAYITDKWKLRYIPTPSSPFQFIAMDNDVQHCFSFAAPRGIGTLSFFTRGLLVSSGLLTLVLLIFMLIPKFFLRLLRV